MTRMSTFRAASTRAAGEPDLGRGRRRSRSPPEAWRFRSTPPDQIAKLRLEAGRPPRSAAAPPDECRRTPGRGASAAPAGCRDRAVMQADHEHVDQRSIAAGVLERVGHERRQAAPRVRVVRARAAAAAAAAWRLARHSSYSAWTSDSLVKLRWKVALPHAGAPGDLDQRDVDALEGERTPRGVQDPLPVLGGITPEATALSRGGCAHRR